MAVAEPVVVDATVTESTKEIEDVTKPTADTEDNCDVQNNIVPASKENCGVETVDVGETNISTNDPKSDVKFSDDVVKFCIIEQPQVVNSDIELSTNSTTSDTDNKVGAEKTSENTKDTEVILIEEDVPPNFFDDLMDEDFIEGLDGLDVVDAWDDEDSILQSDLKKEEKSPVRYPTGSPSSSQASVLELHTKHYKGKELSGHSSHHHKRKSRESPVNVKHKLSKKRGKLKRKRNREELDSRRDPNKTKRDIQRDKDKCAKDEEAKLISEKLKVVETGLVPPGTEMEVDLDKFSNTTNVKVKSGKTPRKQSEQRNPSIESGEIGSKHKSRSRSLDRIKARSKRERHKSSADRRSIERRMMVRRSLERRSMERRSLERRRRLIRARSRSRTPRRRSPLYRRSRSLERMLRDRRSGERIRHRLSRSPRSEVSGREDWLRHSGRIRSRSRSTSPLNRKSRYFLKELDRLSKPPEKKSFLTELQEKLYPLDITTLRRPAPSLQPMPSMMSNFSICPVPAPVPPPHRNFRPQEYDQQFFIGQPELPKSFPHALPIQSPFQGSLGPPGGPIGPPQVGMFPSGQPASMLHRNFVGRPEMATNIFPQPIGQPGFRQQSVPVSQLPPPMPAIPCAPLHVNNALPPNQVLVPNKANDLPSQNLQKIDGYKKLLEEKKITLSDFLSLMTKVSDNSNEVDLQNKIKVITRCQEAIKELTEVTKLSVNFVPRNQRDKSLQTPQDGNHLSPFKKVPLVRFSFTTHLKQAEEKVNLASSLNRLLTRIGTESVFDESLKASPVSQELISFPTEKQAGAFAVSTPVSAPLKRTIEEKFCQTEKFKCKDCEIRKSIPVCNYSTQTVGVLSFDVSCQVTPEDFQKSVRSILKNQSLAHLTSAQLLAAQTVEAEPVTSRDLFPAARKIPSLMEQSPESKRMRMGITNHDSFPSIGFERSPVSINKYSPPCLDDYNFDRYERSSADIPRYSSLTATSMRSNFERPINSIGLATRPQPFGNFPNKLNLNLLNHLPKPGRNVGNEQTRSFYEPPGSGSSSYGGYGDNRY